MSTDEQQTDSSSADATITRSMGDYEVETAKVAPPHEVLFWGRWHLTGSPQSQRMTTYAAL